MIKPQSTNTLLRTAPTLQALHAKLIEQNKLLVLVRSLLPETLQPHCLAAQLKEKDPLLIIHADSSAWASRLRYFSRDLRIKLRGKGLHARKIEVRVLNMHQQKERPSRRLCRLSLENAKLIGETAENIQDADLSAALQRLSKHDQRLRGRLEASCKKTRIKY